MLDYRLKFVNETAAKEALPWAVNANGVWKVSGDRFAVDPIGSICRTPAVLDGAGGEVTPAVIDSAFHINIRLWGDCHLAGVIEATDAVLTPAHPRREWWE